MHKKIKITQTYNRIVASFARNSLFYGLSLDKRASIFDPAKFMNDPWPGDPSKGKNLLNGVLSFNFSKFDINITDVIDKKVKVPTSMLLYVNSFSWIRDIQAVGGVGARKYVRDAVYHFIEHYKQTKKFWTSLEWDVDVTSERIINWMKSYSFFAVGSDDNFQKEVLSSISEQYSHISKVYKAETDPVSIILSMKSMLFCLVAMKSNQKRFARTLINDIAETVMHNIDKHGAYKFRNPASLFNIFSSLIEVRFIARNIDIEISKEAFEEQLSKMASIIRFFRMSDGSLSKHSGNAISRNNLMFIETRHIIDTALSIVGNNYVCEEKRCSINGFDKVYTKKITLIINKKVTDMRSQFNHLSEPGINIFDFEASFQADCLIRRADIAVLWNNHMVKANKMMEPTVSTSKNDEFVNYACEAVCFDRFFQFAFRREISVGVSSSSLSVSEFVYTSANSDVYIRMALDNGVKLERINACSILINYGKNSYVFSLKASGGPNCRLSIKTGLNIPNPTLIVSFNSNGNTENQIIWSIVKK